MTALTRMARDIVVIAIGGALVAALASLGYAVCEIVTGPGRVASLTGYPGVVNLNLDLDFLRALFFLLPLLLACGLLGTGLFLVTTDGRRSLTPGRRLDRWVVQSDALAVVIAGVGTLCLGATWQPGPSYGWLAQGGLSLLGLLLAAAGATVMLQRQWSGARVTAAAVAGLVLLSASAGVAGGATVRAQNPLGTGGTWAGVGFWTAKPLAVPGAVESYQTVTCPSPGFCIAWGEPPFGGSVWSVSNDGGASWRAASAQTLASPSSANPFISYRGVSCWDDSHCLAAGGLTPPAQTSDGGQHWSGIPGERIGSPADITFGTDCLSLRRCLVLGFWHNQHTRLGPLSLTRDGGQHWTNAKLPAGKWSITSTDCTSADACFAIGTVGISGSLGLLVSHDGGFTWHRLAPPGRPTWMPGASPLACTGATACVLFAYLPPNRDNATPAFSAYATSDAGRTWARSIFPSPRGEKLEYDGLPMVACSARRCIAYRSPQAPWAAVYSPLLLSADGGRNWAVDRSPYSLAEVAKGAMVQDLTCDEANLCIAVGEGTEGGVIFYSHDDGVTWGVGHGRTGGPAWK